MKMVIIIPVTLKKHLSKHYLGHRKRLKKRFMDGGRAAVADYELLEMVLFASDARKDVKCIAKALLERFHNLYGVLNADLASLKLIPDVTKATIECLAIARTVVQEVSRNSIIGGQIVESWKDVIEYCRVHMAHLSIEELRLIFLNKNNAIIREEAHAVGTIDQIPLYIREIIKRALDLGAAGLIIIHNHPGGDHRPSKEDIIATQSLKDACDRVNILLYDHIIIGANNFSSLQTMGYI